MSDGRKSLKIVLPLILSLFCFAAAGQSNVKADLVTLRGTTIPSSCTGGQLRRNSVDGNLRYCKSSTFVTLNDMGSVTGILPVANGGTGLASGTSGGVLAYTASGTLASSSALTASQLIIGGGAGVAPSTLAAGSQYQVLRMGASTPAYGAVNLDQSAALSGQLLVANGGTGIGTYSAGQIIYASGTTTFAKVGIGTSGTVLTSNGTAPSWVAPAASPPGMVIMTASTSCPTGTLHADGSAVSRTTYSTLFTAISTTYGVGDGSTTFNLPNSQGVFPRGQGSQTISAISYTGTQGTTQGDQFQGHYHTFTNGISYSAGAFSAGGGAAGNTLVQATTGPITDGSNGTPRTGSETRPANITLKFCIYF